MAAEGKVTNSLEAAACPIKTKLNPALTDKLYQPLNHTHQYISRSSDCLYSARDEDKRALPPTRGKSVKYAPAPDIKLSDCTLRVPSSTWHGGRHGQQISQWKSDPHIATTVKASNAVDTLEQWEVELVARRVHTQHCYLHMFLKVEPRVWEDIKIKHRKFSERMLQLLLAWQQQNGGQADRQQLVTALYSAHLHDLADQVKEKRYVTSHSKHSPLAHTVSNPVTTSSGSEQDYLYQNEKRRSSAPVLQRQMTQNTLKSLLQLRRGSTINE